MADPTNGGAFVPGLSYPNQTFTTPTLTSPTITTPTISSPVLSGSATGTYTLAGTPTITAPTITSPTITGTTAIGNGATLTTPVLSGSVTGTYTLAGTPTITAPAISAPVLSGSATGTYTLAGTPTITAPSITTPTMTSPVVTGDASGGIVVSKTVAFVEDATSTTFTGTVVIPAGATLENIVVTSSVLWSKASARFTCGDAQAATGWFISTNLNATDLLVGEALRAAGGIQAWGGVNGAYLVSASGVFGQATSTKAGPYYVSAGSVIGVVTVTPGAGTAGRTFMTVTYSVGQSVAAVLA